MIKKIKNYTKNLGMYYGIKMLFFNILSKISKRNNDVFNIQIRTKKTGKDNFYIRPFTTDRYLVNNLLLDNGEYDFIYDKLYDLIKKSNVIIDAGACIGMFSRMINKICKKSTIIAIEPETNNFNLLVKNTKKYNNIICKKNGLWNKKCNLIVEESSSGSWGFTVKESKNDEKYDIEAISMEDIINQYKIDIIDILKLDIEGSEVEVFDKNCERWLNKVKVCIIEFHERKRPKSSKKIINIMKKNNFDYYIYTENYVFIKKELIE